MSYLFIYLYLRTTPSLIDLHRLIDKLVHFKFPEFDYDFLKKLKDECTYLLVYVNEFEFDFEKEPDESMAYHNQILTRARRARQRATIDALQINAMNNGVLPHNIEGEINAAGEDIVELDNNDYRMMNWTEDPGERARRIYEWWRIVMNDNVEKLKHFCAAVKLVVLIQTSSASAERVYSQLNFLRHILGDKTIRDNLELRALIRCNRGLESDFNALG